MELSNLICVSPDRGVFACCWCCCERCAGAYCAFSGSASDPDDVFGTPLRWRRCCGV